MPGKYTEGKLPLRGVQEEQTDALFKWASEIDFTQIYADYSKSKYGVDAPKKRFSIGQANLRTDPRRIYVLNKEKEFDEVALEYCDDLMRQFNERIGCPDRQGKEITRSEDARPGAIDIVTGDTLLHAIAKSFNSLLGLSDMLGKEKPETTESIIKICGNLQGSRGLLHRLKTSYNIDILAKNKEGKTATDCIKHPIANSFFEFIEERVKAERRKVVEQQKASDNKKHNPLSGMGDQVSSFKGRYADGLKKQEEAGKRFDPLKGFGDATPSMKDRFEKEMTAQEDAAKYLSDIMRGFGDISALKDRPLNIKPECWADRPNIHSPEKPRLRQNSSLLTFSTASTGFSPRVEDSNVAIPQVDRNRTSSLIFS